MNVVGNPHSTLTNFSLVLLVSALSACAAPVDRADQSQTQVSSEALSATPALIWSVNNAGGPVAFSPDGKMLATGSTQDVVQTLATSDGHQIKTYRVRGVTKAAAFSLDGTLLLEGSSSTPLNMRLYRVADGSQVFTEKVASEHGLTAAAWSPTDPTTFFTAGREKTTASTKIWNTSGTIVRSLNDGHRVLAMAISPDGQRIVSNASGTLNVWRVSDGALLLSIASVNQFAVSFSRDGRYITTGFELFDSTTGALVRNFPWPAGGDISAVTFTKDGSMVIAGGEDFVNMTDAAVIRYFRVSDGTKQVEYAVPGQNAYVNNLAISPDGTKLAYGVATANVTALVTSPF
jgi:WD40 repeat protein